MQNRSSTKLTCCWRHTAHYGFIDENRGIGTGYFLLDHDSVVKYDVKRPE